jgi:leader peptidase (prepilin peptidase) / N-methyltransferase
MESYLPALVAAMLCGAAGLGVPALIARIPEPDEPAEDKEAYAAIAARPGLTWKAAVASLVAGGLIGGELGWAWPLVYLLPLVPVGVALAVVDWRTLLLPTKVIRPAYLLVVAGVVVCWIATRDTDDLVRAGWGFLVAFGLFWVMWRIYSRGMGYGDVRLSGVLGIALGQLGWGELIVGVYSGFLLGGILGTLLSLSKIVDRKGYPFGPFMLVGALVGILWGDPVLSALFSR